MDMPIIFMKGIVSFSSAGMRGKDYEHPFGF